MAQIWFIASSFPNFCPIPTQDQSEKSTHACLTEHIPRANSLIFRVHLKLSFFPDSETFFFAKLKSDLCYSKFRINSLDFFIWLVFIYVHSYLIKSIWITLAINEVIYLSWE